MMYSFYNGVWSQVYFNFFQYNQTYIIHRHVRQFVTFSIIHLAIYCFRFGTDTCMNQLIVGILVGTNSAPLALDWFFDNVNTY